jgi:hypothetical protein
MTIQTHETLKAPSVTEQMRDKLNTVYDPEFVESLMPIVDLVAEAHDGVEGADKKPLALHCADVATSLTRFTDKPTVGMVQLGLLHDAVTKGYTTFIGEDGAVDAPRFTAAAQQSGASQETIDAAFCFARPTDGTWQYDDWISFMMRYEDTRVVKAGDSQAAIDNFPPQAQSQLDAWTRTRDRLIENVLEPPEVTARIAASMEVHPLPDMRAYTYDQAA